MKFGTTSVPVSGPTSFPAIAPGGVRRRLWVGLLVLATLAYYFWTAMIMPGGPPRIHGEESDHFNLLSRGFQKGQLHLDGAVPEELIRSPNPYDPAVRGDVPVLHDASYYRGKYYIYFGPAPVVTLLLPFSVLTGRDLPLAYAVWIFCSVGYLALAGLFLFLQRRHYPGASPWTIMGGLTAVGGASMTVALLRRANIWETSAASGFAYFSLSLLCLVRAMHSPRAAAWSVAGGLTLGLAVASRPTYILCSVLFALPLLRHRRRSNEPARYGWTTLLGAAAGCGVLVLALLAYNYARFQDPLEFGMKYQLSSVIEGEARHFRLAYIPFNFRVYFLSALRWLPYFPFANGIVLPPFPPGYGGYEYAIGLLPNLPFVWFSLVLPPIMLTWRRRRVPGAELGRTIGVIAGAGVLNASLLLCFFGSCIRYMIDFTPGFMLLASIGLLELENWLNAAAARGVVRATGLAVALCSTAVAAASVVNFYDEDRQRPGAYLPVARVLNFPYFWLQERRWPGYSPFELSLTLPGDRAPRQEALVAVVRGTITTAIVSIEYLDEPKIRLGYREPATAKPAIYSPAVAAAPGVAHLLRVSIGGPYSDFDGAKGRLRAQFDRLSFWDAPIVSFGAYPGELRIGADAARAANSAGFSGNIEATRTDTMPELAPPRVTGVRTRITFAAAMAGRSFPLLTTGRTKAGDILFVQVQRDGKARFGYDHWGDAVLWSPEISAAAGETRVVEFWAPAILPPGTRPALMVKVDGTTIWQRDARAFGFAPEDVFLGSNPIGGSTCELVLENGIFEELQLPAPPP